MHRALTADEIDLLISFAREYLPFAEDMTGPNYGPYMGGDPRTFHPDPDDSTPEERERHSSRARPGNEGSGSPRLALEWERLTIVLKTNVADDLDACSKRQNESLRLDRPDSRPTRMYFGWHDGRRGVI
jgi:hypothetical protein